MNQNLVESCLKKFVLKSLSQFCNLYFNYVFFHISFPSFTLLCTNLLWLANPLYHVYFLSHLSQWYFFENIFFSFWLFFFWWSSSLFIILSSKLSVISFFNESLFMMVLVTLSTSSRDIGCSNFSFVSISICLE